MPYTARKLSGKLMSHGENTSIAHYVWLPIEWEGDKPGIRWHNEWKIEDLPERKALLPRLSSWYNPWGRRL